MQIRLLLETRLDDGTMVRMAAFTLIVNAHGGLLEVSQKLPPGHKIHLINTGTNARAPAYVIGARKSRDDGFNVAFELENPSPDFWPIRFPPRDWNLVNAK